MFPPNCVPKDPLGVADTLACGARLKLSPSCSGIVLILAAVIAVLGPVFVHSLLQLSNPESTDVVVLNRVSVALSVTLPTQ